MYITRKGYTRKSYTRKAYIRKDGTRVKRSRVKSSKNARGKVLSRTGLPKVPKRKRVLPKRKRVLPKLTKGALKGYNYRVKATTMSRKRAITKMMKHKGGLKTLRHLVVLRSYNKNSPLYKRLDKDVKYAQKLYAMRKS